MASFSVVSNIASANAQSNLQATNLGLNKALSRLSSGFRINNVGRRRGRPRGGEHVPQRRQAIMNQGIRNANDGLSKLQIKDGALDNISTLLDRLATLATQASSSSQRRRHQQAVGRVQRRSIEEIDREAAVGRDDDGALGFSVFVSSEATVGRTARVSGTIGSASTTADLGITQTTFTDVDHGAGGADADRRRHQHTSATCRTPSAPCRTA